jgi:hypothetical protein
MMTRIHIGLIATRRKRGKGVKVYCQAQTMKAPDFHGDMRS